MENRIKVLIAKPGLDGHDRGAKVVAHALRDEGMEVVYTGLHKTVDQIMDTARQEDVDVIGLSIMSGAHLPISENVMQRVKKEGKKDILVVVGGVIPDKDIPRMKQLGVRGVFPVGTPLQDIASFIRENVQKKK